MAGLIWLGKGKSGGSVVNTVMKLRVPQIGGDFLSFTGMFRLLHAIVS
jgi:hypothetical protein